MQNHTIQQKTYSGLLWVTLSQGVTSGIRFVTLAILLRYFLSPDDLGIIALSFLVVNLIATIWEQVFSSTIIQKKNITDEQVHSLFWCNLFLSSLSYLILVLLAGSIASFFDSALLTRVISVFASIIILNAVFSIVHGIAIKRMQFKTIMLAEITSALVFFCLCIATAFMGVTYWALVWGNLGALLVKVLVLKVCVRWRVRFRFSLQSLVQLRSFGIFVFFSRIFSYVGTNLDTLLIGKYLGRTLLGIYNLAYSTVSFPQQKISSILTRVAFPTVAYLQNDNERLRSGYSRMLGVIAVVFFPLMAFLAVNADAIVLIIYGTKWTASALIIKILCIAGLARSLNTITGSVMLGKGRADIDCAWNVVRVVLLGVCISVGLRWGLAGVAAGISLFAVVGTLLLYCIIRRLIRLRFAEFARPLVMPAILAVVIGIGNILIVRIITADTLVDLIVIVLLNILMYGLLVIGFKEKSFNYLYTVVKDTCTTRFKNGKSSSHTSY